MQVKALIFDMDGTLLDSSKVIDNIWRDWAVKHGIDVAELLGYAHGRRVLDTVRRFAPTGIDIVNEAESLSRQAYADTLGIVAISGAQSLLEQLKPQEWAIVTSAERALAQRWLLAAGLPQPVTMICAEDVAKSKPSPEGYLLAAALLQCDPRYTIIFEDAEAGLLAARAAGARVVGVGRFTSLAYMTDNWVSDYRAVKLHRNRELRIEIVKPVSSQTCEL